MTNRYHGVIRWDGVSTVSLPCAAVVVLEATHATYVERLVESLHENSIVILPFGENPAFDLLKSRLHAQGSLGAQGDEAPHHLWWGGLKPLAVPTGLYRKQDTLFISSYGASDSTAQAKRLVGDFQQFGLDHVVMQAAQKPNRNMETLSKVDFILEQWTRAHRPVFWISPRARLAGPPLLPQALGCDVAMHRGSNGTMTTGVQFFHQTEHAQALLDIWQRLARNHPDLPESLLLDQAWTMTNAQRQLETAWLPDTYWQTTDVKPCAGTTILRHGDSREIDRPLAPFARSLQSGRQFSRHRPRNAHLVMKGAANGLGLITVVIRDLLAASTQDVGEAVEAAASAFAADCGGYSQMEIVLCCWNEHLESVLQIERSPSLLITNALERLRPDSFRSRARREQTAEPEHLDQTRLEEADNDDGPSPSLVHPLAAHTVEARRNVRPRLIRRAVHLFWGK
ncbi:hypothetical protein IVB30_23960 [Bradyrhizobium sp. 200]|uniref:hypothetical protein n=1 Tax=Bradyrhizobium sp. 200 TaxID=2782665 RepID=UPI001FFE644F|nr:hypothetical protein [Bradyrhizobium sp. 200]UPJ46401.1 hypothetical protein IVB30_23960 [Bradyrhizobium sp. 200]